jgi:hypothetical protein
LCRYEKHQHNFGKRARQRCDNDERLPRVPVGIFARWIRSKGSGCTHRNVQAANNMKLVNLYRVSQIGILVCTLNVYGQEGSNNVEQRVNSILSQMTLDDKINYIGGTPFFNVKPIPLTNLDTLLNPEIFQTDAGLGVRNTPASVRYPSGLVLAATTCCDPESEPSTLWVIACAFTPTIDARLRSIFTLNCGTSLGS